MSPLELTTAITALSNVIAAQLSDDDLDLAAICLALLAENLEAIAVQRAVLEKRRKAHEGPEQGADERGRDSLFPPTLEG